MSQVSYQKVIDFWFNAANAKKWFESTPAFDGEIRAQFGNLHASAAICELWEWRASALGRLAEIIVLDQFSRNLFRDSSAAFANDPLALALAQEAVQLKIDDDLSREKRAFIYLPYMHSESLKVHDEAVRLFAAASLGENLDYENRHREIIERFGRYPHRNKILGRISTKEELAFLKEPNSSF